MMRLLSAIMWCAVFVASPALAGDWREIARTAPPDTELMLVVENAAAMRRGESGEALTRLFSTILPLTTTAEAWSVLAKQLNAPPDAAFDMLLGNQVVLLTRVREDGQFEWVFASDVDGRTARKLLDSLGAKPKHIEFNQPIAIIENGRFQLTYEKRGAYATLLFAPTHSEALFIDLIKRMRQSRGASLAEAPEFKRAS